jgi:hypothetical protein
MSPVRELVYPDEYGAEVIEGGDIRLRFNAPGSRFGPVAIILVADDATALASELDKAAAKSAAVLEAEASE